MSKIKNEETKTLSLKKIIVIVTMIFILIPMIIVSSIYFTNENFRVYTNKYLKVLPGPVGKYFQGFPTPEEKEEQKRIVAQYLSDMDVQMASDKLTIIKKEDEKVYLDLVKMLTEIDAKQTTLILDSMRKNSVKKDVLISTIDQMNENQKKSFQDKAKYLETVSIVNAVEEVSEDLNSEFITYNDMADIIGYMKEKSAINILRNLDKEMASRILSFYDSKEKKQKMREMLAKIQDRETELINFAKIYNSESPEKLVASMGNEDTYKIDELSILYRNMNMMKVAQVLTSIKDEDFVYRMLNQIKTDEILKNGDDKITKSIMQAVNVFREYDEKISELEKIYSKMEVEQIASIIENLFKSRNSEKKYVFDNGEILSISDKDIAISLLKKLKQKTVAEVLAKLDSNLSSQISKKLSLPNE
ncbi:hypothetical protein IZY60_06060 [Lutibacter sp. B2]|nr:hypothetical protein [Lutibacter sp. B2]